MKTCEYATVVENKRLTKDVYSIILKTKISKNAKPGQFVTLYSDDESRLLPRPISIADFDRNLRTLRLVYRVVGEGTKEFSEKASGDTLKVMGPLGNGYPEYKEYGKVLLVGGGVGIPPLLAKAKELHETGCKKEDIVVILGYRSKDDIFLREEFEEIATTYITTDDGSVGFKGNTVEFARTLEDEFDVIYSCGPKIMLSSLKKYAEEKATTLYVSLEERMACGIGACLACTCNSTEVDGHTNVKKKRTCVDGPVFDAKEVEI